MGAIRERRVVAALSPSQEWKDRVKWMPDEEVLARYAEKRRVQAEKLLHEERRKTHANLPRM